MAATDRRLGWVVAIEGPSGAGKSRLCRALAPRLSAAVVPEAYAELAHRPDLQGRGPLGWEPTELALLAQEQRRFVRAERERRRGGRLLLDTGYSGPLAYSAGLVGLGLAPPSLLRRLERELRRAARRGRWGWPDLTVYLDVPPALAARRAHGDPAGHPKSLIARHGAVARAERRIARRLAEQRPDRFRVVRPPSAFPAAVRWLEAYIHRRLRRRPGRRPGVGLLLRAVRAELTPRASAASTGSRRSRRPSARRSPARR